MRPSTTAGTELLMRDSFLRRGGLWVVGQSVLMLAVVLLGPCFQGDRTRAALVFAGFGLLALAGVVGIAGVVVLGRARTPFPKPAAESRLITHGIYSLIRHPLYASVMLASLGWVLIWQSWPAGLAAVLLVVLLEVKVRHEERCLRQKFPEYVDYARRVRRFIPGVY